MNKEILSKYNVTMKDYKEWCIINNKPSYKKSTQREYICILVKDRKENK